MYYSPKYMNQPFDLEKGVPPPPSSWSSSLPTRRRAVFNFKTLILVVAVLLIVFFADSWYKDGSKAVPVDRVVSKLYSHQENYWKYENRTKKSYEFFVITDMDKLSKAEDGKEWIGYLKGGLLLRDDSSDSVTYRVEWTTEEKLTTAYNEAGRGMELSELVYFNGRLLTCDDRTGIVFEIIVQEKLVVPRYIFTTGDGRTDKGFKCEWMTVKDDTLYVGSMGKEFTKNGKIDNLGSQWVKTIDLYDRISHVDWRENFERLREKSSTLFPGYLVHEAIMWNPQARNWVVMPRRLSNEPYDETVDEEKGTNVIFTASHDFQNIEMNTIGPLDKEKGTSSFKFIPFREGEVLQLKTIEHGEKIESYVSVINIITGQILMSDVLVDTKKYEGVEIV